MAQISFYILSGVCCIISQALTDDSVALIQGSIRVHSSNAKLQGSATRTSALAQAGGQFNPTPAPTPIPVDWTVHTDRIVYGTKCNMQSYSDDDKGTVAGTWRDRGMWYYEDIQHCKDMCQGDHLCVGFNDHYADSTPWCEFKFAKVFTPYQPGYVDFWEQGGKEECVNIPWVDFGGQGCEVYVSQNYCNITGGYGHGWDAALGTFWDVANFGYTGPEACCGCGGGEFKSNISCYDEPMGWQSKSAHYCDDYMKRDWCTRLGGYGNGWRHMFGTFADWATGEGVSAPLACCACGGGISTFVFTAEPMPTPTPTYPKSKEISWGKSIRSLGNLKQKETFNTLTDHYMAQMNAFSSMWSCFPGEAAVDVQGSGRTPMGRVQVGDRVQVERDGQLAYEPVLSFLHALEGHNSYLVISHARGEFRASASHIVFVGIDRKDKLVNDVEVGDELVVGGDASEVLAIRHEVGESGMYAPHTSTGTLVVDGVVASNYATSLGNRLPHSVAHAFFFPVRMYHRFNLAGAERSQLHPFVEAVYRHFHLGVFHALLAVS